ncbi:MAG: kelch repeat-containing protein [bacterium]|nr:kelch repeat-containing protein [bacterium]
MYKHISFVLMFLLCGAVSGHEWSETGSMVNIRKAHNIVLLTDGRIIVLGGYTPADDNYEIFNPATGTWSAPQLLPESSPGGHDMGLLLYDGRVLYTTTSGWWHYRPRTNDWDTITDYGWTNTHCYTLLYDGDVLGFYNPPQTMLYDYATEAKTALPACGINHKNATQTLLPSGDVLLCGQGLAGSGLRCDRYNHSTQTWTQVANMNAARYKNTGVLLPIVTPDAAPKVLMLGGATEQSELYDWQANTWTYTSGTGLNWPKRDVATLALLPEGKVLAIGGEGFTVGYYCELYDPATQSWSITDTMKYYRQHNSSAILPSGKVITIGSFDDPIGGVIPEVYDPTNGYWQTMSNTLGTARCYAAISMLPILHTTNCSTNVLIIGGENGSGALSSCELYNYSNLNSVSPTGSLNAARTHHTANLLAPALQQVLVAGGRNGAAINTSEIYSMATGTWSYTTGAMSAARFDHSATLLGDGRVLVTGGEGAGYLSSCELYTTGAGTWSSAGTMTTARARHSAVLLLNGNIMVIGGETSAGNPTATCEIWNGTDWTTVPAASMATARSLNTATLLQSGKVLVAGGMGAGGTALSSCEIYDPTTNTWTAETPLSVARYAHNTSILYSGLILVSGGTNGTSYFSSCEIWDPAVCSPTTGLHAWKTVPNPLANTKAYQASVLIPIEKPYILSIGGKNAGYLDAIERFDIGLGYSSSWQSVITNYPSVTAISDSMNITGSLFRGISQADGGNHCHVGSNDHPIISLVRVGGGNWQGNGGGEILTMPMSSSWDTMHTKVHPVIASTQGYYRLWSIVNGIPCKWYADCPQGIEDGKTYKSSGIKIYPNPGIKEIKFALNNKVANLSVDIYDLSGRTIKSLNGKEMNTLIWDGKDTNGKKVSAGMYFYNVRGDGINQKGKFVMLK